MSEVRRLDPVELVEVFAVPPRFLLVKLTTASGASGWGEAGVQTRRSAVAAAIRQLAGAVVGTDARERNATWQVLRNTGFYAGGSVHSAAVAALDIALWDLAGRLLDEPVHVLLGGAVRDALAAYVWIGAEDAQDEPSAVAAEASQRVAEGFRGVKLTAPHIPHVRGDSALGLAAAQVAAVRSAVGPDVDVMIDCHGRVPPWHVRGLIERLAPSRPLFVEEPFLPDHVGEYPSLCAWSPLTIAAGERAYDPRESLELLRAGVRVLQPDVANAGGLTEARRITALASAFGAAVAPHCAIGPVALAASINLGFADPAVVIQEYPLIHDEVDLFSGYLLDPSVLRPSDGAFLPPGRPGLGIDVDEQAVRTAASDEANDPAPPRIDNWDGSAAQW